jgi:nucleosome binding factor SPN SPT16 subunit
VPFHVSTIKNITMPAADKATWLRINFYIPGGATGKDVPKNTQQLVARHAPRAAFIKELTFRSLDSTNLTHVFMLYQELRKRIRAREQKKVQEKDLVAQTKLVKIKDQRVPRLQVLFDCACRCACRCACCCASNAPVAVPVLCVCCACTVPVHIDMIMCLHCACTVPVLCLSLCLLLCLLL